MFKLKNILIIDNDSVAITIFKDMFSECCVTTITSWDMKAFDRLPKQDVIIYDRFFLGANLKELFIRFEKTNALFVDCSDENNNLLLPYKPKQPHLSLCKPIVPELFYRKLKANYEYLLHKKTKITNVIVVDDNDHQRERLKRLLEDSFTVTTFSSAITALQHIKTIDHPMVIVLDIMMENMNGFEFLKNLREEPVRDTPVLCLSSKRIHRFVDQAISLGANEYMFKPYNSYRLKRAVSMLANGS